MNESQKILTRFWIMAGSALLFLLTLAILGNLAVIAASPKIIVNEFYRGSDLNTGDEWIEVLLIEDLTAAELEGFYVGDSTSSTAAKFSGYNFTNMGTIASSFPKGTIIVIGGTAALTEELSYDPSNGDWNILLRTSGSHITGNGSNGNLAGTDVVYVDTDGTNGNSTISMDGFAVNWDSSPGTLGATANVTITGVSNNTGSVLTSDLAGASTAGNWTTGVAAGSLTLGLPNGGTNSTYISNLRLSGPNLTLSKSVSPDTNIDAGDEVTYTIIIANSGSVSDTNVIMTDTGTLSTTYKTSSLSCTGGTGSCTDTAGSFPINWAGTITAAETVTVTFVATHTGNYGETVTNTAEVSGTANATTDVATFTVKAATPDLSVAKTGPTSIQAGDNVVYTVTVENLGASTANNVVLTDTLPASTTYLADDSGYTCPACSIGASGVLTFDLGSVAGSVNNTFNLTVTTDISLSVGSTLTNTVDITTSTAGDPAGNNSAFWTTSVLGVASELLLTEIRVTPTAGEMIEIYNPTANPINLSDVYLTDATHAGSGNYYYNIVTGSNAGGGGFGDFHARFPDGATINPGEFQTISLPGSDDFVTTYGISPTYELFEDGAPDAIPDMREALPGSINNQGGLTNGGEVVILYFWDGINDLVTDLDYAIWGDDAEAVDKTGISIDGPDPDSTPSTYLNDTATASQDLIDTGGHAFAESWQREDYTEGAEVKTGGNGAEGHDETSEDTSNTYCASIPSPGADHNCGPILSLNKTANPNTNVSYQGLVTYTITLDNIGPADEPAALLTDTLPLSVTFSSWISQPVGAIQANDTITWTGGITTDQLLTLSFVVSHTGDYNDVITNTAYVSGSTSTDSADAGFTVQSNTPEISVVKTGPTGAYFGSTIVYNVTVQNIGGATATAVILTDTLPLSVTYISDDASVSPTNPASGVYVWSYGDLVANFNESFNLTVTLDALTEAVITNTVELSTTSPEDNPANNSDSWETRICGQSVTPIYDIQGNGLISPLNGQTLTTEGVVTADLQESDELNGFYIQDPVGDGDPTTSDGIFVYDPSGVDVAEGDIVAVTGTVAEFLEQTQIGSVSQVLICDTGLINATPISLPVADVLEFEQYEGMLVSLLDEMTASQNYFQGRYGQVTLSSQGRLIKPTNIYTPSSAEAIALADENLRRMLVLDDGSTSQNPNPIPYIGLNNTLRAGDTVQNLSGIIDYGPINSNPALRHYRIQPTGIVTFTRANARTASPSGVGGDIKVASFNVLNYFNGDGMGGGFPTSRGADSIAEFNRQRTKIITAIVSMDADVIGLMEIENDGYGPNSAIQDLVNGLNNEVGSGTYAFVDPGVAQIGTDEIAVGFIYKTTTVNLVGSAAILDATFDPDYNDNKNRPALAQTFANASSGEALTVVVNHLKSKGSNCNAEGDPDTGDGQGNCNLTRTKAMSVEVAWLATDPTSSGDPDFMIIGDLNAYGREDPIVVAENAGFVNLSRQLDVNSAYSYVFDGEMGYLDHALASASLAWQVNDATFWHINADEPSVIDYNTEFKPQDLYQPDAYRSSDHDPVVVGLNLGQLQPDVSITKSVSTSSGGTLNLPTGDVVTYTVSLANNGLADATDVLMTDTLPAGVTFGGYVAQGSAMLPAGDTISWGPYNIGVGISYTIIFTASIDAGTEGQTITNTAWFSSANAGMGMDSATFTVITTTLSNTPPVAEDDSYTTDQDLTLTISAPGVLTNDTDADSDLLTAVLNTGPLSGTLSLALDGSFVYTPTAGFYGVDNFTYHANDGQADSNVATVSITVSQVITANTPPVAEDDSYTTDQDLTLTISAPGVLTNDTDADSDPLTAVLNTGPLSGTLSLALDGSFVYTPTAGWYGVDNFTYHANDGQADSNVATVSITVTEVVSPGPSLIYLPLVLKNF